MEETNRETDNAYMVCVDNTDYEASLEKHKFYRVSLDDATRAD